MGDDTRFVCVRGPRGDERSVCVYSGVPVSELQDLLSSIFKLGSRTIVGLEDCDTATCIPLHLASKSPQLVDGEVYTLMLEEGARAPPVTHHVSCPTRHPTALCARIIIIFHSGP